MVAPTSAAERVGADRLVRRGVRSAAALSLAWMLLWAGITPAFWGADTTSHVTYAVEVAHGRWPTVDTVNPRPDLPGLAARLERDVAIGRAERLDLWTANHPPLYFLAVGLLLRAGLAVDAGGPALLLARAVTAVAAAGGVLAVGWLARVVVPQRPRVIVLAAAGAGLSPALVHFGGQIYNDAPAMTLSTVALAAAVAAIRTGPTRRLVVLGGLAAGAGAAARSSSIAVAAVVIAAFAIAGWRRGVAWGPPAAAAPGPAAAAAAGIVTAGLTALLAAPPALVNVARYGSVTGASTLLDKFDRAPGPPVDAVVSSWRWYADLVDRFASELSIGEWLRVPTVQIIWVVLLAGLLGLALHGVRRRHPADGRAESRLVWLVVLAPTAATLLSTAVFVAAGGNSHSRYLLPGLGGLALVWAVGIAAVGGPRGRVIDLAAVALLATANTTLAAGYWVHRADWYARAPALELPSLVAPVPALAVALAVGVPALVVLLATVNRVGQLDSNRP